MTDTILTVTLNPSIDVSAATESVTPEDFYARVARLARERGSRMVLDVAGPALAAALEEGVYLVKPNLRELRELTREPLEKEADWLMAADRLFTAGKVQVVGLSLGHRDALLVANGTSLAHRADAERLARGFDLRHL